MHGIDPGNVRLGLDRGWRSLGTGGTPPPVGAAIAAAALAAMVTKGAPVGLV